jgi:DNA-directed RNA polymerase subunit omega
MENEEPKNNKYRDVLIAAKRARQLQGGAEPMIHTRSQKVCRVAQDELAAGKISAETVGYRTASDHAADATAANLAAEDPTPVE